MDPLANRRSSSSEGKAAMLLNLDFNQKTSIHPAAQAQGFTYSATLVPKGPTGRRGGIWIPDALQLSASTPNPDEAWLALKWFTDKDTGLALALQRSQGTSTTPGARPDVYNDPRFLNHDVFPKLLQELDRDANALPENYQGRHPPQLQDPGVQRGAGGRGGQGVEERGRADAVVPQGPQRRAAERPRPATG